MSPPANPRAHVGRDSTYSMIARWPTSFNPRARVGRDPATSSPCARHCCFNPRARLGRDPCTRPKIAAQNSFNPRARVGRDHGAAHGRHGVGVSIHAPAWGATLPMIKHDAIGLVSIHAPAWGATKHGCKRHVAGNVSIHAPAWGATIPLDTKCLYLVFQYTRPRGARPHTKASCRLVHGFNPRARVGRDVMELATYIWSMGFNPRARVGRDHGDCRQWNWRACFNPRARVGRDLTMPSSVLAFVVFQSTRPRGARLYRQLGSRPHPAVSIHAPAWGATRVAK